jgi:glyoxylase-like metal-dependent hydrolase (beta-lactamase superfamily II)
MKKLTVTLLAVVIASGLINANQQPKTPVEKSYLQAREVLEAGLKAMGGLDELQKIADISREFSGTRSDEGQGMQPVWPRVAEPPVLAQPKMKSVRDLRGGRAYEEVEAVIFGGQPLHFKNVVTGATAFGVSEMSKEVRVLPPPAVNNARAARFRRHPESLLLNAANRPEALRWVGEGEFAGRKQRVISFADVDSTEVSLYFDAATNLLTKAEYLNDDPVLGDIVVETVYGDWKPVEKVVLPFRYVDRVGGSVLQDLRVTSVTMNTHPPDSLFAMPESSYAKLEPTPPVPAVKKLADDVYALLGSYNSLFVVFKDHVLVVEAGANNRYSAAAIAEIKKIAPDKPIRYLVSTHFHFDHLSGVRSYIAEGTTIVTTPAAKSVIERIATTSHVMRPDALSRNPKAATIETIADKRVFDDGVHTVELYRFASPHAGEMIVAYLPKEKILFEADMLDISEGGRVVAGDDTVDLAKQIERLALQVETIIPVHGRVGTLADLTGAVTERVSKRE